MFLQGGRLASTGKFERVGEYVMSGDDVRNCTDAEDMIAGPSEASNSQQSAISYGQSTPNDLLTISNSIRSLADFYSDTIIKKSSKLTASKSELHVRKEPFHERSQLESNWKEILIKKEPPSYLEEVKHPLEWYSKPESARLLQTVLPNEDWRNNFQSEVWFQDTSGFQDWLTMADFAESTEERAEAPGDSTLESLDIQSMRQWFKDYKVLIDSRLTAERLEKQLAEDMKITENMINVKVEPEDDYEGIQDTNIKRQSCFHYFFI